MKNTLNHYIRNFQDKHKSIRLYLAVFLVLAAGIFLVVSWKLHHTGISMTADYQCGYTAEHVHTDACYTKTLVCQKEETDGQEGHTHTESCYEEKTTLNCEKEEHVHGQECYDEDGTLICEKEEHTHTENCYRTGTDLWERRTGTCSGASSHRRMLQDGACVYDTGAYAYRRMSD